MGDIVQSAAGILASAQRSAETSAHNIANAATPGYRARLAFPQHLETASSSANDTAPASAIRFSAGQLTASDNPLHAAIAGEGFFVLSDADGVAYTRDGRFSRGEDGRLLGMGGRAVQLLGGGDVVLPSGDVSISANGEIESGGEIVGRLAVVGLDVAEIHRGEDGVLLAPERAVSEIDAPNVHQGFVEGSNVSMADEMIAMMQALRRAETGQRVIGVYDDLLGRVLSTLGQAAG